MRWTETMLGVTAGCWSCACGLKCRHPGRNPMFGTVMRRCQAPRAVAEAGSCVDVEPSGQVNREIRWHLLMTGAAAGLEMMSLNLKCKRSIILSCVQMRANDILRSSWILLGHVWKLGHHHAQTTVNQDLDHPSSSARCIRMNTPNGTTGSSGAAITDTFRSRLGGGVAKIPPIVWLMPVECNCRRQEGRVGTVVEAPSQPALGPSGLIAVPRFKSATKAQWVHFRAASFAFLLPLFLYQCLVK